VKHPLKIPAVFFIISMLFGCVAAGCAETSNTIGSNRASATTVPAPMPATTSALIAIFGFEQRTARPVAPRVISLIQ
jgi:hypothetical protein